MSKLLGAIQENRKSILQDWTQRLKSADRRLDLLDDSELDSDSRNVLSAIADAHS
jgi:hypothetical protein